MHAPAGVPPNGGLTFAIVTRPELAKGTATRAMPVLPLPHACTARDTPRIAAITSVREGVSAPPPAAAGTPRPVEPVLPLGGREVPLGCAAGPCVEQRS